MKLKEDNIRLAIILDDINLYELGGGLKRVVLFDTGDNLIIAIGEDRLPTVNINYLCLWLLSKRVSRLYCDGLNKDEIALLKRAEIETYPLKKIRNNPILHAMLLDDMSKRSKGR